MKRRLILGIIVGAALAMLAWALPILHVRVTVADLGELDQPIPGSVAAPALMAFGLAGFAVALALFIAGPLFRRILGGLAALLGLATIWQLVFMLLDPVRAIAPRIQELAGVADLGAVRELIPASAVGVEPGIAAGFLAGLVLAATGAMVIRTAGTWGSGGRRFERAQSATAEDAMPPRSGDRSVAQWDALTFGDDPTDEPADGDADFEPSDRPASESEHGPRDG